MIFSSNIKSIKNNRNRVTKCVFFAPPAGCFYILYGYKVVILRNNANLDDMVPFHMFPVETVNIETI